MTAEAVATADGADPKLHAGEHVDERVKRRSDVKSLLEGHFQG